MYKIKIKGDYDFIKLYEGEIYVVNCSLLIKCEDNIWEQLLQYNMSYVPKTENKGDIINSSDSDSNSENSSFGLKAIDSNKKLNYKFIIKRCNSH